MDEKVEQITSELKRRKYADNSFFKYGRNADFDFEFTRKPKELYAPFSTAQAFTDAGSFQSRKYFTRHDYVIQNPINGAMQVRSQIPRIRPNNNLN